MSSVTRNIGGKKFGELTPIRSKKRKNKDGSLKTWWFCCCSCGKQVWVRAANILGGCTRSCGHLRKSPNAALNRYFAIYKFAAKDRKYSFSLSKKLFDKLCLGACYYCGRLPHRTIRSGSGVFSVVNGIDRKDNRSGYSKANSVSCCTDCNRAKRCLSSENFIKLCRLVVRRHHV
jgi:hypothetical protein